MVKAVRVHEYGGPDKLVYEDIELGEPGPGEARIRHTAIGLNYADLHNREGRYPLPSLPHVLGGEGAGVVEAVGPGVIDVKPGDRVAYAAGGPAFPPGSYAEARLFDASRLVLLPDEIDDRTAAGMIVKGLTAQYLLKSVYPVGPGDTVVVHAAAGGVGTIMTQWAAYLGARVIGVVGSQEKAEMARQNGCMHALVTGEDDVPARVRALTAGEGVPVVFDAVGKDTIHRSMHSLRKRGLCINYGGASGLVDSIEPLELAEAGSIFFTRPHLADYLRDPGEIAVRTGDLFAAYAKGDLKVTIDTVFPMQDARKAHETIEGGLTQGKLLLDISA